MQDCQRWVFVLLALLVCAGCSTARRLRALDTKANSVIAGAQRKTFPGLAPEALALDRYERGSAAKYPSPLALDLRRALATAALHSRDYQTNRETLYRSAVALCQEAHDWDWNVSNSLSGLLGRDLGAGDTTLGSDATVGLSRKLKSGGKLSLSLALDTLRYLSGDHSVSIASLADASLTQPLLSGRGALVAQESLTQAERNLVYSLRSYIRARQSLVIDVAERYYGVLSAGDGLEIAQRNYRQLIVSRERSEELASAGRLPAFQVDQARQDELSAHATLVTREQAYQASRDALKRVLGLALEVQIEVDRQDLALLAAAELPQPPLTLAEAIETALAERLDLATMRDQLEDADRAVQIARDAMLPTLDLSVSGAASSPTDSRVRGIAWRNGAVSAGLDAELPFDRTDETAALRLALIARDQHERSVEDRGDQISADVRSDWRDLKAAEENYGIQKLSVELAEKRIESTELLFQAGRVEMRDVLDARTALIQAQNSVTRALVNHRLSWLRLLTDLETLPADPETLWSPALELQGPAPAGEAPAAQPENGPRGP